MYDDAAVKIANCVIRAEIIEESMGELKREEIEVYVKQERTLYAAAIRLAVRNYAERRGIDEN